MNWTWDETLYAGSAAHYGAGRMPYPAALGEALRDELGLDGTGRRLAEFTGDLRGLLADASRDGRFAERTREIDLILWHP